MRAIALVALLSGCTDDRPIEDRVTIETGIFGKTVSYNDTNGEITAFSTRLDIETPAGGAITSVTSDDTGFYQIALEPAEVVICTDFGSCSSPFPIVANELRRCSFEAGPGGGMWSCQVSTP